MYISTCGDTLPPFASRYLSKRSKILLLEKSFMRHVVAVIFSASGVGESLFDVKFASIFSLFGSLML